MRVIAQTGVGGVDVLIVGEADIPMPAAGEVLIHVQAAGINRPDIFQRQGAYPPPKDASPILGLEVAGIIVGCGKDVTEFSIGDHVCALVNGGGYAEFAVAPAGQCLPLPKGYSFVEAAALPETFFTVWHNLVERGGLSSGHRCLIHGGGSGIGTAAIQIARLLGAEVFTTVGSTSKKDICEQLGAIAINYREEDFVAVIREKTHGEGVNVILDMVAGDYVEKNIRVAAPDAHIIYIASLQGSRVEIDINRLMAKRIVLTGSTLRPQSLEVKSRIAEALLVRVWPYLTQPAQPLSSASLQPLIDSVFRFEQVREAHERMESNRHIGKIVLDLTR